MAKDIILLAIHLDEVRSTLRQILEEKYHVVEVKSTVDCVSFLKENHNKVKLLVSHAYLPPTDGFRILEEAKKYHWDLDFPIVGVGENYNEQLFERATMLGMFDYLVMPEEEALIYRRITNAITLFDKERLIVEQATNAIYESMKNNTLLISTLSGILEYRNGESNEHVLHIEAITKLVLEYLYENENYYGLTKEQIHWISTASTLHDIGKIEIPEELLKKPDTLTPQEFDLVKTHCEKGAMVLRSIKNHQKEPLLKYAIEICLNHHERWDGGGYPKGLKEDNIPISAQVVAIADCYDSLISEKAYRKAYTHRKAVGMISKGECGLFNPLVLQAFVAVSDKIKDKLEVTGDSTNLMDEIKTLDLQEQVTNDLSFSKKTMMMYQEETSKLQFYMKNYPGILFDYSYETNTIKLFGREVSFLKGNTEIKDPFNDELILNALGKENSFVFSNLRRITTPDSPEFNYQMTVGKNKYEVRCKTMWNKEKNECIGFIGEFLQK